MKVASFRIDGHTVAQAAAAAAAKLQMSKVDVVIVHGAVPQDVTSPLALVRTDGWEYLVMLFRDMDRMLFADDCLDDDYLSGCVKSQYGLAVAFVGHPAVADIIDTLKESEMMEP